MLSIQAFLSSVYVFHWINDGGRTHILTFLWLEAPQSEDKKQRARQKQRRRDRSDVSIFRSAASS